MKQLEMPLTMTTSEVYSNGGLLTGDHREAVQSYTEVINHHEETMTRHQIQVHI